MTAAYTYQATPEWDSHAVKRYAIHRDDQPVAWVTITRDIPFHGTALADLCTSLRQLEDDAARPTAHLLTAGGWPLTRDGWEAPT